MEVKFCEFRKSDKSLKHELESIYRSCLSHLSYWCCDSTLISYIRGDRFEPFIVMTNIFVTEFAKTFRESSTVSV